MPGYTKDKNSLASGIPNRNIGPETGSFGNATVTNTGDTGEGTNQDHESSPPPAAALGASRLTTDDMGERRSFDNRLNSEVEFPESDVEPVYQQIADGGDHFDHDKHLHEGEARNDERLRAKELENEERIERRDRPLP